MDFRSEYSDDEWTKIKSEFQRIQENHHYLDHAGTTLYSEKQLEENYQNFSKNLYCNPHTSKTTEDLIDQIRFRILEHFNTTSDEYSIVFTSGTTNSLKIIGECFNFQMETSDPNMDTISTSSGTFVYVQDNHTSVLGMREVVNTKNIHCIQKHQLLSILEKNQRQLTDNDENLPNCNSLIVYPAQCNFNGYKYPMELIKRIHENGLNDPMMYSCNSSSTNWYICLDAASFVSTNSLNLKKYHPDFVCLSFYKIFGYPTGLGAILVSKRGQNVLKKRYYGGGTVKIAMSMINWHRKRDCFHERMEDGTIPFLSIISLSNGFETLKRLIPNRQETDNHNISTMDRITKHCFNLIKYCYQRLSQLKYKNGNPVIRFYHDTDFQSDTNQGNIINFNVLHDDGSYVGFAEIACMSSIHNIYLRTGCFCNPGACQRHLKLTNDDLRDHFKAGHICGDSNDLIDGIPTGSVRVSVGYMTTKENIDAVIQMIHDCYLKQQNQRINLDKIKNIYKLHPESIDVMKIKSTITTTTNRNILLPNRNVNFPVKLKQICVYPIKSCAAFKSTKKWPLTIKGLKYDRDWMIITGNGVALTQKTESKLCLIRPQIQMDRMKLILNYPNMKSIELPLEVDDGLEKSQRNSSICQSKVCGDRIEGIDYGNEVAVWLSEALNMTGLRLIRQSDNDGRVFKNNDNSEKDHLISLSNQAQFLLVNTISVDWLARKVNDWNELEQYQDEKLESVVDRFRGNLIVEAPEILGELTWDSIEIGKILLKAEKPCARCQMICIDQSTGIKTTEPLRTIAKEFQGKMKFGMYLSIDKKLYNENNCDKLFQHYWLDCDDIVIVKKK